MKNSISISYTYKISLCAKNDGVVTITSFLLLRPLKVGKNRKHNFHPKLLPKNELVFLSRLFQDQDGKTNSLVRFSKEVLAGKFAFDFY